MWRNRELKRKHASSILQRMEQDNLSITAFAVALPALSAQGVYSVTTFAGDASSGFVEGT